MNQTAIDFDKELKGEVSLGKLGTVRYSFSYNDSYPAGGKSYQVINMNYGANKDENIVVNGVAYIVSITFRLNELDRYPVYLYLSRVNSFVNGKRLEVTDAARTTLVNAFRSAAKTLVNDKVLELIELKRLNDFATRADQDVKVLTAELRQAEVNAADAAFNFERAMKAYAKGE